MQKINKVKWNRHEIYTLISWDRTSGTQHDKARPSADKLAAQKHDHNECTPRIKQYLLSTQHPLPSHSFLPSSALLPLHKVCTHTHTHANTHTHGNKYKPDRNDNEPLSPLSIDRSTRNQYAIRLNLGEWGAWCNICTWISWVTGAPQNNLQNSSVNNALFFSFYFLSSTNWRKSCLENSPISHNMCEWGRPRLISGRHLFAMRFSFQAAESRQAPVRLNLQHGAGMK